MPNQREEIIKKELLAALMKIATTRDFTAVEATEEIYGVVNELFGLSKEEEKVMKLTADLWNATIRLPGSLTSVDAKDIEYHIHAIQRIILARNHMNQHKH